MPVTFVDFISLLRKNIKLVIIVPLLCAIAVAGYCWLSLPDEYSAEVSIYALTKGSNASSNVADNSEESVSYSDLQTSQLLANDFVELTKNDKIREDTASALGLDSLSGYSINITSSTSTRVIKVEVTGRDARTAAGIANELTKQLGETAVRVMGIEAVNVVNEAQIPAGPSGPPRALYTLAALAVSLALVIVFITARSMFSTRLRSDKEIEELIDVPVIGRFPYEKGGKRR